MHLIITLNNNILSTMLNEFERVCWRLLAYASIAWDSFREILLVHPSKMYYKKNLKALILCMDAWRCGSRCMCASSAIAPFCKVVNLFQSSDIKHYVPSKSSSCERWSHSEAPTAPERYVRAYVDLRLGIRTESEQLDMQEQSVRRLADAQASAASGGNDQSVR